MKLVLLLSLALLFKTPAVGPAPVRVTFSSLTKLAYLEAKKACISTKPVITFPLKKTRNRILIPTAKGPKVFQDKGVGTDNDDQAQFEYKGYLPQFNYHFVLGHYWEQTQSLLIADSGNQQLVLNNEPRYSPDIKSFVVIAAGIEYSVYPNEIRLYRFENGRWRQVWKLEPSVEPMSWEPEEVCWLSNNSLLLKRKIWTGKNPGATYTYAKLLVQ